MRPTGVSQILPEGAPQASSPPRQAAAVPIIPPHHITPTAPTWDGEEQIHYVQAREQKTQRVTT